MIIQIDEKKNMPRTLVSVGLLVGLATFTCMMTVGTENVHQFSLSKGKPNFVILFLDDHGWGDVGANVGANIVPETPNVDSLAASGVRFTDMHSGFPVCTASRSALLTGRLAPRTGVFGNFAPSSSEGLALGEVTMADVLREAGYDTHMIGKWHLGHAYGYSPTFRGFDTWLGLPYSGDMGCLDSTPQGCKASYDRHVQQPACPALCPADNSTDRTQTAIPLYDSVSRNCSGA